MKIAGKPNCLFTLPRIRPMASTSCSSSIRFIALLQHLLQSNQTWQLPKTYFSSWGWSNFFYMEQKWGLGRERRDLLWLKTEPSVPIPKTIRKIYWHIVALQCCVSFYCTAKWISESLSITYLSIYIPSFLEFLPVQLTTKHWVEFPVLYSGFSLVFAQSRLTLCDTWTVAYQAPLSLAFSRQEYWSRLLFPFPGILYIVVYIWGFPGGSEDKASACKAGYLGSIPGLGRSPRASPLALVIPISIQNWFPLRLTGLICSVSTGLWKVFSSTTVWKHQFFGIQPSLWSSSHICTWLALTIWILSVMSAF